MKKPPPILHPGTFNLDEIPNRRRFRDPLGHEWTRRGTDPTTSVAVWTDTDGTEHTLPLSSVWRPLELI